MNKLKTRQDYLRYIKHQNVDETVIQEKIKLYCNLLDSKPDMSFIYGDKAVILFNQMELNNQRFINLFFLSYPTIEEMINDGEIFPLTEYGKQLYTVN